jgi:hypothetical protein
MTDKNTIPATVELVYTPDTYTETERQEGASWPLGSGFYEVVLIAGDARIPIQRIKAGAVDKLIALGKANTKPDATPPAETPTPE